MASDAAAEYADWLSLLEQLKAQYQASPNRMLQMVNAHAASDTRAVAQWDFSPKGSPQLVGVRRTEFSGKFDDVFVLLLKGLVFKFQGSTEPGASDNPRGTPFLVQGQHDYHFGWHKKTYLALRPMGKGVLVVRRRTTSAWTMPIWRPASRPSRRSTFTSRAIPMPPQ